MQSGGFLSTLFGPLLKTGLSLTKIVIKILPQSALIPLEITAALATDTWIHKSSEDHGWQY